MKFPSFKLASAAILCSLTMSVHADSTSDLTALLNNVRTMKAAFTQTVYDNRNKAIQKSFGTMTMQRPGKFRWEVTKPMPQLIIANQTKLWIYDPDLQQVTIRSLKKAAGETPALLLSNVDETLHNDFNVAEIPSKQAGVRTFKLTPKHADNSFAAVTMGFLKGQINEMDLQDQLGHLTKINYKNIQTNISLAASLFTFKAGAGVDVIDETRKG